MPGGTVADAAETERLRENIARVQDRIARAAQRVGRDPATVTLVGASKTVPPETVAAAVIAGLRALGENQVQEAATKIPSVTAALEDSTDGLPQWHLLGHLQTNKARAAVELFDVIESVDSLRLADAIARRGSARPLSVLVEVYVGEDADRPGFRPGEVEDAVARIREMPSLVVEGLMTVAPLGWEESAVRGAFNQVRVLADRLWQPVAGQRSPVLSMGMSDDFEWAIEEGATMVRIGRALFGPRS